MKRKIVFGFVLAFLIGSQVFGQNKKPYVVTISHDTLVNRYVVKINPAENIIKLTDGGGMMRMDYPLDSVENFYFKDALWKLAERMENPIDKKANRMFSKTSNLADLLSKKKEEKNFNYIFLPETMENKTFHLGVWGSLFGTKTESWVRVKNKGKSRLYEYDFLYNSGSIRGINHMMYLYNDSLGLSKVYFLSEKDHNEEAKPALRNLLIAYIQDRPDLVEELTDNNSYDYKHVHKLLKKYFY